MKKFVILIMFFLLFLCSCGNSTQKETTKIEPAPTNVAPKLSYTLTNVTHQKEVDGSYHCLKVGILIENTSKVPVWVSDIQVHYKIGNENYSGWVSISFNDIIKPNKNYYYKFETRTDRDSEIEYERVTIWPLHEVVYLDLINTSVTRYKHTGQMASEVWECDQFNYSLDTSNFIKRKQIYLVGVFQDIIIYKKLSLNTEPNSIVNGSIIANDFKVIASTKIDKKSLVLNNYSFSAYFIN